MAEKETNTSAQTHLAMEYKHNNMKKCISFQHFHSGEPTCLENFKVKWETAEKLDEKQLFCPKDILALSS